MIIQETVDGGMEVSAMDPAEAMGRIDNTDLKDAADQVRSRRSG